MSSSLDPYAAEGARLESYARRLEGWLIEALGELELPRPWRAVALAYAHGLDFGPAIGVLTQDEHDALAELELDGVARYNPAEWEDGYELEALWLPDDLDELAEELRALGAAAPDGVPGHGRAVHVRVATALRPRLVASGHLAPDGLVFATDFELVDLRENAEASNPAPALAAL